MTFLDGCGHAVGALSPAPLCFPFPVPLRTRFSFSRWCFARNVVGDEHG